MLYKAIDCKNLIKNSNILINTYFKKKTIKTYYLYYIILSTNIAILLNIIII